VGLATALRQMIDTTIAQERVFLRFMAHNALEHPPLMSFFRNFVVEKSGEHKDTFDIKTRAIAPLTDAARVLALDVGCHELTNTAERFERVAELHPAYQKLCSNAATAYQMLLRFRAVNGLQTGTSGQFLRPGDVNKVERQMIRTAFDTIAEVQKVLRVRYHLDSM
jgi:CBS domain-containing protein